MIDYIVRVVGKKNGRKCYVDLKKYDDEGAARRHMRDCTAHVDFLVDYVCVVKRCYVESVVARRTDDTGSAVCDLNMKEESFNC